MSRSCSFVFSQDRISSILPSTNKARRRLSFGDVIGRPLIHKLVNPIKVARPRFSDEVGCHELLVVETEPQVRATHASVLRKPDTAVGIEIRCLDLVYCRLYQPAKFLTLLLGNRCPQILNFRSMLPHKNNQSCLRNPAHPRITDELGVERKQPLGDFGVSTSRCFPIDQAPHAVQFTDGVQVGNKFTASSETPRVFHLKVLSRITNTDTIILGKPSEQMNPLVQ